MNIQQVRQRVKQAGAWCARHARVDDARRCLRSPQLIPPGLAWRGNVLDDRGGWLNQEFLHGTNLDGMPVSARGGLVERVAEVRAALLGEAHEPGAGRLLVHHPDLNLWDGGADAASSGFFDDTDVPPWDSWVAYVWDGTNASDGFLLSWVPSELVPLVDRGVRACVSGSLAWAAELNHPVLQALRTEER